MEMVKAAKRALAAVLLVEVGGAKAVEEPVTGAAARAVAVEAAAARAEAALGEMVVGLEGSCVRAGMAGAALEAAKVVVTKGA